MVLVKECEVLSSSAPIWVVGAVDLLLMIELEMFDWFAFVICGEPFQLLLTGLDHRRQVLLLILSQTQ